MANTQERKDKVAALIDEVHELKKKCKHKDPCDKCNFNCNDPINCKKCQIVNWLRIDIGLEPL